MDIQFVNIADGNKGQGELFKHLSIEESNNKILARTILDCVEYGTSLLITFSKQRGEWHLFLKKGEAGAGLAVMPEEFLPVKKFKALNEAIFHYADKEGYTPDQEWFQKRATRLNIKWSDEFDSYLAPAAAICELTASYCLSSGGMVVFEKEMLENRNYCPRHFFKGTFIFGGKEMNEKGFHEVYIFSADRLRKYLDVK